MTGVYCYHIGRVTLGELVKGYGKDKIYIDEWDNSKMYPLPEYNLPEDIYLEAAAFYDPAVIITVNEVRITFTNVPLW